MELPFPESGTDCGGKMVLISPSYMYPLAVETGRVEKQLPFPRPTDCGGEVLVSPSYVYPLVVESG